jgi:hypothetical protein
VAAHFEQIHAIERDLAVWTRTEVPENAEQYPETRMFGRLPASGFYIRHANAIRIANSELRTEPPEERPAIVLDDVHNVELRGITISAPSSTEAALALRDTTDALIDGARTSVALSHRSGRSRRKVHLPREETAFVTAPSLWIDSTLCRCSGRPAFRHCPQTAACCVPSLYSRRLKTFLHFDFFHPVARSKPRMCR